MPATTETHHLSARPEALAALHTAISDFWVNVSAQSGREVPMRVQFALTTAASEIAANIIRYAETESFDLALLNHGGQKVEARFTDRGIAYEPTPEPGGSPGTLAEGGFGLALARRVVHSLEYDRTVDGLNCWRLVVLLPPAPTS